VKPGDVPPMDHIAGSLPEVLAGSVVIGGMACTVYPWSPRKGGDPTEVHLALRPRGHIAIALRIRSPKAYDELVALLYAERRRVWPDEPEGGR
jgi:hypothetical protein